MTTPAWPRVSLARRHLIAAARISIVITQRLRADETVRQLARLNNANPMTTDCRDELGPWVQHGDFTIENLLLVSDRSYGLIDWEHLSVHSVPLYDAVSLLLSAIPLLRGRRTDNWTAVDGFRTAFLGDGAWAYLFRSILSFTAKELGIPQHEVRDAFVFCLRERVSFHRERASSLVSVHEAFVRLAVEYYPAHEEKPDLVRS
jgi:Phosphotransferase enzyme family